MKRKTIVVITVGAILAMLLGGIGYVVLSPAPGTAGPGERKVLYWTDPMVPGYRSDKPGKSPFMDMELVPVYGDAAQTEGPPAVTIRPEVQQNLGVRTTTVTRATATHTLTAHGYLFRHHGAIVAIADVFERNSGWLKPGLHAEVQVADLAGQRWPGVLEGIESDQDIGGRSLKVRVRLLNPDTRLQANMSADVILTAAGSTRALLVPREALIYTARRSALIRVLDDGRFQPVEVVTGEEFGDLTEIRAGVQEGERIVVSGQFLIDSESSVRESLKRMQAPTDAEPSSNPRH
jgi:hypothetical protein